MEVRGASSASEVFFDCRFGVFLLLFKSIVAMIFLGTKNGKQLVCSLKKATEKLVSCLLSLIFCLNENQTPKT